MIDFKNFKANCSQLGDLMGSPRWNKPPTETEIKKLFNILGRGYGELSEVMKDSARQILLKEIYYEPNKPSDRVLTDLILIYCYEMYGKTKITKGNDSPHQLEKANMAEPESIKLLSKIDGENYVKNEELFENKWFKGIPDIIVRDSDFKIKKIIEIKTSYDLPSFIMTLRKPESSQNLFETMGYMDLLKCKNAEIVHCLVDMPDKIVSFEEKRLKDRYNSFGFDEETISNRIDRSISNMEYSGIPDELKIFRRPVTFNNLTMKDIKRRVGVSGKWLQDIHNLFTRNLVNLPETEQNQQEDNL